ncbi:hypothetical protein Pcinc_035131 [Petrolisthes cinctipes]|uniref:Uncharacterized protein n=1 Tax=Petrolisthes cinctipes TaxID=88211 RepID=A0AAE1BX99_PETCI|nr:hypothetical protein Pcinc_035131 [Petrolisthes cinctipes]
MVGVRVGWVLLGLLVGVVTCGPPTPQLINKRSAEDIQFGNQQNLPIGLLDDNALPGAFPSSETSEEAVEMKEGQKKQETPQQQQQQQPNNNNNNNQDKTTVTKENTDVTKNPDSQQQQQQQQQKEEEEEKSEVVVVEEEKEGQRERREEGETGVGGGGEGLIEERKWHQQAAIPSLQLYRPHWGVPRLYTSPIFSLRRRRSLRLPSAILSHRNKKSHRSLAGLRNLMRARGDVGDEGDEEGGVSVRRQKRGALDLDELLKEVDVVDLITMLSRPPHHQQQQQQLQQQQQQQQHLQKSPRRHNFYRSGGGFGTVRYAPAPPRFAPQPKLFPDYEESEVGSDGAPVGGMGLLKQNVRAAQQHPEAVMMPGNNGVGGVGGRRVWRRSDGGVGGSGGVGVGVAGYGLSALPGFKRSSVFRANNNNINNNPLQQTPEYPPVPYLNPSDVYSLAAMLGAELDPVTHRLRRAAM